VNYYRLQKQAKICCNYTKIEAEKEELPPIQSLRIQQKIRFLPAQNLYLPAPERLARKKPGEATEKKGDEAHRERNDGRKKRTKRDMDGNRREEVRTRGKKITGEVTSLSHSHRPPASLSRRRQPRHARQRWEEVGGGPTWDRGRGWRAAASRARVPSNAVCARFPRRLGRRMIGEGRRVIGELGGRYRVNGSSRSG
jgi:hypothetical protein